MSTGHLRLKPYSCPTHCAAISSFLERAKDSVIIPTAKSYRNMIYVACRKDAWALRAGRSLSVSLLSPS